MVIWNYSGSQDTLYLGVVKVLNQDLIDTFSDLNLCYSQNHILANHQIGHEELIGSVRS